MAVRGEPLCATLVEGGLATVEVANRQETIGRRQRSFEIARQGGNLLSCLSLDGGEMALAVKIVVGFVIAIFWTVVVVAAVIAVLWALKTLVW